MPDDNRRVFPRSEGEYAAWYQLSGSGFVQCVALDIGVDGACLMLDRELPEESFEVDFQLAPDWLVRASARMLWQRKYGGSVLAGIRYRPLRSHDRHLIGPWVRRQMRKENP